jgi:amidase
MSLSLYEYTCQDATGLAGLVRTRQVAPSELLDAALAMHEKMHGKINAVNCLMLDQARARLASLNYDAPFAGVPFLLKDLLCAYEGVPMSSGSHALRHWCPPAHSHVTRRFLQAGFIPFGKTSVPECGLIAATEPEAFGPTRNPWSLAHSPGGSSGGSAAAVAARIVPAASAGDGGGSIRIPASVCGLFGLKPTRGRVSNGPFVGESWHGAVSQHVLSRSVRDSAAILDVISGYHPGDPYAAPDPGGSFLSALSAPRRTLRIALSIPSLHGVSVDQHTRTAVEQAGALLESLGHRVDIAEPPVPWSELLDNYLMLYFGAVAADVAEWEALLGVDDLSGSLEAATLLLRRIGQKLPVEKVEMAQRQWNVYAQTMATFHNTYDAYVLPVNAASRWNIGQMSLSDTEKRLVRLADALRLRWFFSLETVHRRSRALQSPVPFTQLANLTGQPAMSVPLFWCEDGFPVGVQFVGRFGDERTLLALAAQIEEARPWSDRRPSLVDT